MRLTTLSKILLSTLLATMLTGVGAFAAETSDEALLAAAEKMVDDESPAAVPVTASKSARAKSEVKAEGQAEVEAGAKAESETDLPVFLDTKKAASPTSSTAMRLGLSLALIAVVAGALVFAGKRWPKKANQGGNKTRIDILHQLHLGPKRGLTLIRVAGEVMLIGMTDQSVNLIKTVTLIDDELEGLATQDFNNFLEDEFSVEDVRSVIRTRA